MPSHGKCGDLKHKDEYHSEHEFSKSTKPGFCKECRGDLLVQNKRWCLTCANWAEQYEEPSEAAEIGARKRSHHANEGTLRTKYCARCPGQKTAAKAREQSRMESLTCGRCGAGYTATETQRKKSSNARRCAACAAAAEHDVNEKPKVEPAERP